MRISEATLIYDLLIWIFNMFLSRFFVLFYFLSWILIDNTSDSQSALNKILIFYTYQFKIYFFKLVGVISWALWRPPWLSGWSTINPHLDYQLRAVDSLRLTLVKDYCNDMLLTIYYSLKASGLAARTRRPCRASHRPGGILEDPWPLQKPLRARRR